jgi:hypothetical protein
MAAEGLDEHIAVFLSTSRATDMADEWVDTTPQLGMDYCRQRQENDQKNIA